MNSRSSTFISFAFLLLFVLPACKKQVFDYRNKYIGNWNFHYYSTSFNASGTGIQSYSDSGDYQGSISYTPFQKSSKNYLIIQFSPSQQINAELDKQGNFKACTEGAFSDERSISFKYSGCGGLLGSGTTYYVTGTKQ